MLLFVGLLMAFFQGGLVRRVKPGNEKKIALIVSLLITIRGIMEELRSYFFRDLESLFLAL